MGFGRNALAWLGSAVGAIVCAGAAGAAGAAGTGGLRELIIRGPKPYDALIEAVRSVGGEVSQQYRNVDAIAASVPEARLAELVARLGPGRVSKDALVAQPHSVLRPERLRAQGADMIAEAVGSSALDAGELAALPGDGRFGNGGLGARQLHARGLDGQGVTVAIIDTGTANTPAVPALADRVAGGESFVPADPVVSATSRFNAHHGTWVGTVIAGHALFGYYNTSPFLGALRKYAPTAIAGPCPAPPSPGTPSAVCWVPQVGVAPQARLYALKVFDSRGGGAPESRIIAAMDRAITLRHNFNLGASPAPVSGDGSEDDPFVYDALPVQVVNMSLGGGTLYAGRDLEDQLTLRMVEEGIVLVSSAGNDGFGAMTVGSPGSGLGAVTVGATNDAVHERIWAETAYGLGDLYRPTAHEQTADFSSRGPDADGRLDPDLVANGVAVWAEGTCSGVADCTLAPNYFVWGTSFAAPAVAGAAALLRQAYPDSEAGQIRNALIFGADPTRLGDRSARIDQGRGTLDVVSAATRLEGGIGGQIRRPRPTPSVEANLRGVGFEAVRFRGNVFSTRIQDLVPGQVAQFFVPSDPFTERITVLLTNVTAQLPAARQNRLFGDDVFLKVLDAPTSFQDRAISDFVKADSRFVLDRPQTGLVRVSLQGDWTNAGAVAADLRIVRTRRAAEPPAARAVLRQGDMVPFEVEVPPGVAQLAFETQWVRNWSMYPTSDLDMVLVDPSGHADVSGATLASPERAVVANPRPGLWTVVVSAYAMPVEPDSFALYARADGVSLRVRR